MSSLGSLVVSLAMDTARFTSDVGKAAQQMDRLTKEATKIGVALGASISAGAAALGVMVKSAIDAADASSKLAQSIGVTTEDLSRLTYAADLSGVSQEELGASLAKLARHASEAASGGKSAAAVYEAMGISITDGNGNLRSTTDLLGDVAERFAAYENSAAKTALAQELFGRSGAKLIPFLNSGRDGLNALAKEADALGLTLDTKAAVSAEAFNDSLTRLAKVQTGFINNLTQAVLPALEVLSVVLNNAALRTNGFKDAASTLVQFLSKLLVPLEAVAVLAVNVAYVFKQAGNEIGGIAAQLAALARLDFKGFRAIGDMMKEDANAARREIDKLSSDILNWSKKLSQAVTAPQASYSNEGRNYQRLGERISAPLVAAANTATAATSKIKESVSDVERKLASMRLEVDTQGTSERLRGLIELMRTPGVTGAQIEEYLKLSRQIEAYKASLDSAAKAERDRMQMVNEGISVYDATRTPAEKLANETSRLNDLLAAGAISWDTYSRAVFAAQDSYDQAIAGAEQTTDAVTAFVERARQNIQDSLGDAFVSIMQGNFKNIGDAFVKMLQRMVAEALAAKLTEALFGAAKPGGTGGGGIFGNVLSSIGSFLFGGKAYGGPVSAGRAVRVGEHGPEVFMPAVAGSIIPERQLAGPPQSIVVNVQAVPGMTRQTALQQGQMIGEGVQRALTRNG
jgi:hypothetical protein